MAWLLISIGGKKALEKGFLMKRTTLMLLIGITMLISDQSLTNRLFAAAIAGKPSLSLEKAGWNSDYSPLLEGKSLPPGRGDYYLCKEPPENGQQVKTVWNGPTPCTQYESKEDNAPQTIMHVFVVWVASP
jgi:hypothetical protein